ncbi:DEAD/DEAH box helicase-like protein [Pseudonocardia sp. Ae168_Ps1]|uniref:helicase-related protein n=1 Tax=unclassified Pseudonocardia TaxID=2619320 RepID=UPI00096876FF|nr:MULTISPECIES: helicase-related protein [unclassified Pseudonocardia]OLL78849.1 DEAD/DEAH box helicase-like protein [Pseudonocardia sp. Ae168_Ps1]OLL87024.1 DEAD/DEAH box helicase-like protein [Pseudonocardia sp. Ae263_Ps1]OLL92945.1 DEAD/DEAH box helicase-like protein [Pseudonocardia sp. Ae356_Ps1]
MSVQRRGGSGGAAAETGAIVDTVRRHLTAATGMAALSESFSLYVYDALEGELADVDLRLLLWGRSLEQYPLNGLDQEHLLRARLDQHRVAKDFARWAADRLDVRTLRKRVRTSWLTVDGTFPYAVKDAGLDAEGLGVAPSPDLLFPSEISDVAEVKRILADFDKVWHSSADSNDSRDAFLSKVDQLHRDNDPESVYLRILIALFEDFVGEAGDETEKRGKTGFFDTEVWRKLYKFQRDGVLGAIEKLEQHNGCILADSVGLGKTFEGLAVIKYYELRNDRVLVLAPKRLRENWTLYRANDSRNPLLADRFGFDVLNHTDLSRSEGRSADIDLAHVNWGNYDLVVIDESHNFRNNPQVKGHVTRYQRLMDQVFRAGVKTKVLMLSATPVNTRLADLKNQVLFATEGADDALAGSGIRSVEQALSQAQGRFNAWQKSNDVARSARSLVDVLGMDYIRLLDLVTIARSRKHIEKYYGTADVGRFPERRPPENLAPDIDSAGLLMRPEQLNDALLGLNLSAYRPTSYVLPSKAKQYAELYDQRLSTGGARVFRQADRDNNIVHLVRIGLLKRLESSVASLTLTVRKIHGTVERTIDRIEKYEARGEPGQSIESVTDVEDLDSEELDDLIGNKTKVFLADVDRVAWLQELREDQNRLSTILDEIATVDPARDGKLAALRERLRQKAAGDNPKVLVFTAFADTARYLYDHVAQWARGELGLYVALITGTGNKSTLDGVRQDMHSLLTAFSPRSKGGDPAAKQIDIVIATDTISEGQNLQDCDTVVNYDIHWNPVRIVQRFGRVDRLGSTNRAVQLVNFWPPIDLDSYINLEKRVSSRMTLLDVSATGEENVLDSAAMNDLDYRRKQLHQMQEAAPTMEDLADGLSITDLTLGDFRMDAASRPRQQRETLAEWPLALFGVTRFDESLASEGLAPGAVFLLRVRDGAIPLPESYPLAPHLLAYVRDDGELARPIEEPKLPLDVLRHHCLDRTEPDSEALADFHRATRHGARMTHYRGLLDAAVRAASGQVQESAVASLFSAGPSTLGAESGAAGLDAVDVVAWVAVVP